MENIVYNQYFVQFIYCSNNKNSAGLSFYTVTSKLETKKLIEKRVIITQLKSLKPKSQKFYLLNIVELDIKGINLISEILRNFSALLQNLNLPQIILIHDIALFRLTNPKRNKNNVIG